MRNTTPKEPLILDPIGRSAWSYALAHGFAETLGVPLEESNVTRRARNYHKRLKPALRRRAHVAAGQVVDFLCEHDRRLSQSSESVTMQSATAAQAGDVRNIVIETSAGDVGLSANHRRDELSNLRITGNLDFIGEWFGLPCSQQLVPQIRSVLQAMRRLDDNHQANRRRLATAVLLPLTEILERELSYQQRVHGEEFDRQLFRHLVGRHDFYKVLTEDNSPIVQSYNLDGTLRWGRRVRPPSQIRLVERKNAADSTLYFYADQPWQWSLRIGIGKRHPLNSLRFHTRLVGYPAKLYTSYADFETTRS